MGAWVDRAAPSLAGATVMAGAFCLAYAVESGTPTGFLVLGGVALAAAGLGVWRRRADPAERMWDGARTAAGPLGGPEAAVAVRPAAQGRSVVRALARVEARELVCSPWFGLGVGFLLYVFLAFGVLYSEEDVSLWAEAIQQLVSLSHPFVGMLVVAAHACTTRPRHDGADELFEALPVGATTRAAALLTTAWVPALTLVVFLAAFLGVNALVNGVVYGPAGRDAVADLLSTVVLGVGGVALGVALGRWAPLRVAPVIALGVVGALSLRLLAGGGGWTSWSQLSSMVLMVPEVFLHRAAWWHLAWLLGLAAVVAGVALLRSDPRWRAPATGSPAPALALVGVGAATALIGGILATRPMPPSSADLLADRVARPAAHQRCTGAGTSVQVCSYRGYENQRDRVVAEVSPVAARLPAAVPAITLRQVYEAGLDDLPPEVRRRLPGDVPPLPPGQVPLSMSLSHGSVIVARIQTALVALDLPVRAEWRPEVGPRPEPVDGQARGVVALWLATRGLDPEDARAVATAGRRGREVPLPADADAFERGFAWPASCRSAPVVWSAQDLGAVRAMLGLPEARVLDVVHGGWDRWRRSETGTDELLAELGLPSAGPYDTVASRDPGPC